MTRRRDVWIVRIKGAESEHRVAVLAVRLLAERLASDPSFLKPYKLDREAFEAARDRLEPTYLIRLFAEFESGLREA